jgi:hypothetical protein
METYGPQAQAEAKKKEAEAALLEMKRTAINKCINVWLESAKAAWEACSQSSDATVQCNAGWSRNDPDFSVQYSSAKEGYSKPTFSGITKSVTVNNITKEAKCNLHKYRCRCAQSRMWIKGGELLDPPMNAFNPRDQGGRWYSADHDNTGCNMIHAPDASPPQPGDQTDAEFKREVNRCEAASGISKAAGGD